MSVVSRHPASPVSWARSFWRNRGLILQLTQREVISRYRGSVMGLAWSFFNPLLMLAVYTFVFSQVFQVRWGGPEGSKTEFAIFLFVGILMHGLLAECMNKAPSLILSNVGYVKKVVFPLEVLPWVALGSALFHMAISTIVLLLVKMALDQHVPWTVVYLPVIVLPLAMMSIGVAWLLAAVGVYIRDIGQVTTILTTVLLFMAPVFYPVSAMPEQYRAWLYANPLTFIIEQARAAVITGAPIDFAGLAAYAGCALVFVFAAYWVFQRLRNGFADVL